MCIRDSLGGMGNDEIYGENGEDEIYGEGGNDVIEGGADDDALNGGSENETYRSVSYTHLRAHETVLDLVCRLLLEKKKITSSYAIISIPLQSP